MHVAIDPALGLVIRASLALLLAAAARHKLRDLPHFRAAALSYRILPAPAVTPFAAAVPGAELALAAMLASGTGLGAAAPATAVLMSLYAFAIAVNVRRGRTDLDCGCMGPAASVPVSSVLVIRNLLLCAASLVLVVPASGRQLTALDLATVMAATTALVACWSAGERMLALAPRVARVRGTRRAAWAERRTA